MKWTPALPKKDLKLYFTKGKELMTPDLKEYIGTYYKKRDNFFTYIDEGKGPKTLLVKLITDSDWRIYVGQNKYPPIFNPKLPRDMAVFPKDDDYEKGYFDRIFIRKGIDKNGVIKEIDNDLLTSINAEPLIKPLYKSVKVRWKLTGPRKDVNIKKVYDPYNTEVTQDEFGQDDSGVVYGVESTNRRTIYLKNKEMNGLISKIINYIQFAQLTNISST